MNIEVALDQHRALALAERIACAVDTEQQLGLFVDGTLGRVDVLGSGTLVVAGCQPPTGEAAISPPGMITGHINRLRNRS